MIARCSAVALLVGALAVAVPAGQAASVLRASDFTYVGAFSLPIVSGTNTPWARGLTHRYVNGQIRLMTAGWQPNSLLEFAPASTPAQKGPYPAATLVKNWGSNWHQGAISGFVFGLYWDEIDKRLYWISTSEYSTYAHRRGLSVGTIDDAAGVIEPIGRFGFPRDDPGYKWLKGLTAIPQPYRSRLNGWRLAGGFGGYESIFTTGGASMGPALIPFDHRRFDQQPTNTDLPTSAMKKLVYHYAPNSGSAHASPFRARRNTQYRQAMDDWHVKNDVGYWTWADHVGQGGLWLHTGTKQGFLVWARQAMGGESAKYTKIEPLPDQGLWVRRLTLAAPLQNTRVGEMINVPDVSGGHHPYVAGRVRAISGHTLDVSLIVIKTLNPNPRPPATGEIWRGVFYYNATIFSSGGRGAVFIYDSEDLLKGTAPDQVQPAFEESWPIPTIREPIPSWTNSSPGTVVGATFDSTANRLYLLVQTAYPFPVVGSSRAMVFVYDLTGEGSVVPAAPQNVRLAAD